MSGRLGHIQRGCLRVIKAYEAAGKRPTTFNIAAEVYQIKRDRRGNRAINDSQRVATRRALAGLRSKGLIVSHRDLLIAPDGAKTDRALAAEIGMSVSTMRRGRADQGQTYANAELCCFWSMVRKPLRDSLSAVPSLG